jgi:hypothetical protein
LPRSVLDRLVRKQLIRLTPSWTTTMGTQERDAEQEIFGKLVRSFQTWTDAPPGQWHRWYDWNFHLEPEAPYAWLRGKGNEPITTATKTISPFEQAQEAKRKQKEKEANSKRPKKPGIPIISGLFKILGDFVDLVIGPLITTIFSRGGEYVFLTPGNSMECEWDTGVFGAKLDRAGPMFNLPKLLDGDGNPSDLVWPMTGDYVWICGRSIYDGGHETEHDLCRSELHPCKAIATARYEAWKFKGQTKFLPAVQFMFFASNEGGYVDLDDLSPKGRPNYEFIVDLPEDPSIGTVPHPVAHTPDVAVNTIMLRKYEPLQDFAFPFAAVAKGPAITQEKPKVEILPPKDPSNPGRRQAKITIPKLSGKGHYGCVVVIGWPDISGESAARVKKVTVKFQKLRKFKVNHDIGKEEWRYKAGVNNRWFQWEFTGVKNSTDLSLKDTEVVFHQHVDDPVRITAHGAELNVVDDFYFPGFPFASTSPPIPPRPHEARDVKFNPIEVEFEGREPFPLGFPFELPINVLEVPIDIATGLVQPQLPAVWKKDIDVRPPKVVSPTASEDELAKNGAYPVQRLIARKLFTMMFATFNDQNSPLGLLDAFKGPPTDALQNRNPIDLRRLKVGEETKSFLIAYDTWELGDSAELVTRPHEKREDAENPKYQDYMLHFTIKIEDQ